MKKSMGGFILMIKMIFQIFPLFIRFNYVPGEVFFIVLNPVLSGTETGAPIPLRTLNGLMLNYTHLPVLFIGIECCCNAYTASPYDY